MSGYSTGAGNRISSDGVRTYTHDANGNVTQTTVGANGETWVYGYDQRNQLLTAAYSATSGGAVTKRVTFAYDSYGNKISREAWDGTTTSTERYGHDGWDTAKPAPIGNENFDIWVDLDGSNNLTTRRMYGPEFDGLTLRENAAGDVGWYLTDRLGSVRGITNGAGTPLTTLTYNAWGEVLSNSTPAQSDSRTYTGRIADTLIGGYDYRDRWFIHSRFLQPDFWGFNAGDANLYRYVGNGPTNATDPSGKWWVAPFRKWGDDGADALVKDLTKNNIPAFAIETSIPGVFSTTSHRAIYVPQRFRGELKAYSKRRWGVSDVEIDANIAKMDDPHSHIEVSKELGLSLAGYGFPEGIRRRVSWGIADIEKRYPKRVYATPSISAITPAEEEARKALAAKQKAAQDEAERIARFRASVQLRLTQIRGNVADWNLIEWHNQRLADEERMLLQQFTPSERQNLMLIKLVAMFILTGPAVEWALPSSIVRGGFGTIGSCGGRFSYTPAELAAFQTARVHAASLNAWQPIGGTTRVYGSSATLNATTYYRPATTLTADPQLLRLTQSTDFLGGSTIGQVDLNGLLNARNLTLGRIQGHRGTCGLHSALSVIDDVMPRRGSLNWSKVRSQISGNGGAGLSQSELMSFLDRNLPDAAIAPAYGVDEAQFLDYVARGNVIAAVDGNHWVRVTGTIRERNTTWVKIYDPARGHYEQEITSFMIRMHKQSEPVGYHNCIISIRN